MRGAAVDYKSYLTPMIHIFKDSSGRIKRRILCYRRGAEPRIGKADHKYDPEKCGWSQPLGFLYIGPVLCCTSCHRHIWSKESYDRCPQCNHKLTGALRTGVHSPVSYRGVPDQGTQVMAQ